MLPTTFSPVYDDLIDVLATDVAPERLLAFRLSPDKQERLDDFLAKSREGTLSDDETAELEAFAQFEHITRTLKANALQAHSNETLTFPH